MFCQNLNGQRSELGNPLRLNPCTASLVDGTTFFGIQLQILMLWGHGAVVRFEVDQFLQHIVLVSSELEFQTQRFKYECQSSAFEWLYFKLDL